MQQVFIIHISSVSAHLIGHFIITSENNVSVTSRASLEKLASTLHCCTLAGSISVGVDLMKQREKSGLY
jgi:hypothetical protein